MHDLVGSPELDLPLSAWHDLYQMVSGFEPDLIIELGRGYGNSTCVFTEAARRCGALVVSIGNDGNREWETATAPRLEPFVGHAWFQPLTVFHDDICGFDYGPVVRGRRRVFVYWDAHGVDVAAAVFAGLLPLLPAENLIVVDDVWAKDGPHLLPPEFFAGPFASLFDEVEPLWEYLGTLEIPFRQGDRSVSFTARP
jgi:cephalosporin hydroxylase